MKTVKGGDNLTKDELIKKLRSAYRLQRLVDSGFVALQNLRDNIGKITPVYSLAPGGGRSGQRIENAAAKIIDLENTLRADKKRLAETIAEIRQLIAFVDDPLLNRVLDKRYLQYQKWEQIAEELGYARAQVYRLHSKAANLILEKMRLNEIE